VTDQGPPHDLPGPRHASGTTAPVTGRLTPASRAGAHRAPTSLKARLLWSTAAVAAAALVTVLVLRAASTEEPAVDGAAPARTDAVADLVAWADAELPAATPVRVPEELLDELAAADDERFRPLDAADAHGLLLVIAEPPPDSVVLARFERPGSTALTIVDPAPGRPTAEELGRRQRLCAAILANPRTGATGRAADVLQASAVDARLLGLLALLVAQLGVGVADFPPAPGEPVDGPLARHLLIDRVGEKPLAPHGPVTDNLLAFLDAQLPPFAPDTVEVTDDGLLVGYRYVSAPDALVTENTP
jgi:hypothetical protein